MYFKKDDWTDFIRASVFGVLRKNDGDGGGQGQILEYVGTVNY